MRATVIEAFTCDSTFIKKKLFLGTGQKVPPGGGAEEISGGHENFQGIEGGPRKIFGIKRGAMKIFLPFQGGP